jgi:DNA-binding response OmpR family regulator
MNNKILVVDDEIEICLLVTKYLKKMGFEASYALSIADALSKISMISYDLLFVDLNLADGSGYDLIHTLQHSNVTSKIIIISAYDSERQKACKRVRRCLWQSHLPKSRSQNRLKS